MVNVRLRREDEKDIWERRMQRVHEWYVDRKRKVSVKLFIVEFKCLENVWGMSGECPENVWIMTGECLRNVWGMSGECLENVWRMSGECLRNVWRMSGE